MTAYIDPSSEQFLAFKKLPRDTPIMMLNLVLFKESANYKDQRTATGAEAYRAYGEASAPIFSKVGGEIIWRGNPESVLIGPQNEQWDTAFIARYPTANAFLEMVMSPEYQAIVYHRQAAVETSRLIRLGEQGGESSFS